MSDDLIKRLREAVHVAPGWKGYVPNLLCQEAAGEIERLREALKGATVIANQSGSLLKEHEATIERLSRALTEMVEAFEPFTSKPMGAPNSDARIKQQLQIAAHRNARATLPQGIIEK